MTFNVEFLIRTFWICMEAVPVTLKLAGVSFAAAALVGFWFALIRLNGSELGKRLVTIYLSVIRGIPIVVQILIVYSIAPSIIQAFLDSIGSSYRIFDLNPIVYAYMVFILNTTAGLTEVFRSAILTVDRGQLEAAQTAGLTVFWAYIRIVIPQALVAALPNLCTTATSLIKSTSLAFLMTVKDITAVAKIEAAYGYNYIEAYTDIWLIYILLCMTTEAVFKWLEKRQRGYLTGKTVKQKI